MISREKPISFAHYLQNTIHGVKPLRFAQGVRTYLEGSIIEAVPEY
jgi:hypothetical protein